MRWLLLVAVALAGDAPEISRSVGKPGGVVVLWPRVSAADGVDSVTAGRIQAALADVARGLSTDVDVRPEPERVCPRPDGCKGVAVGAIVSARGGGCAVVVTVSMPGPSPQTLLPWIGEVELREPTAPFREPPESRLVITDYARCSDLATAVEGGREPIAAMIKAGIGR